MTNIISAKELLQKHSNKSQLDWLTKPTVSPQWLEE